MRDNWELGCREGADREKEGGSSVETHKVSSLAGAGYNDTQ